MQILLADDHSVVRSGIKSMLLAHYQEVVIYEAGDGAEIAEEIKTRHHDLVVVDINMPKTDFLSLIPWILIVDPPCKVLVFSSYTAKAYGVKSLQSGAYGFLNKSAPNDEILRAVDLLLQGRKYFSAELGDIMVDQVKGVPDCNPITVLSIREMEVARLLFKGLSLSDIGEQLNLGYTTVVTYRQRIFKKLQIDNVVALARLLQASGITE